MTAEASAARAVRELIRVEVERHLAALRPAVGTVTFAGLTGSPANWSVRVAGVLDGRDLEITRSRWGSAFIRQADTHRGGIVGRTVIVEYLDDQPIIRDTIGD